MIATIILSAGASVRMGRPKALCTLPSGESFLARILACAKGAGTFPVVVIGPPHGDQIRACFPEEASSFTENPRPGRGMLSSVQAGLAALPGEITGALIWPVDIPLLSSDTLRRIVKEAPREERLLIPRCGGRGGHPLYVPRSLFAEISLLDPAHGLRRLRENHAARIRWLDVDDAGVLRDFDAPHNF